MNGGGWVAIGTLAVSLIGAVAALIKTLSDRRVGISGDERQARVEAREDRRDTIADRDGLIAQLLERVRDLEAWKAESEAHAEERAKQLRSAGDHIDALEHHIWKGLPPPPPPRPAGL